MSRELLTDEDKDAIATLAKNGRLMIVLVPEDASDAFVARLTAWSNFILDTRIMLPLPIPAVARGDGLVCPYCRAPAISDFRVHATDCTWRTAIERWGAAQIQIDEEFAGNKES